jgi:protein-disulfide isomerase
MNCGLATKAERREQARAERLAREQERLAAERRRRLFWFAGAIVVVIAAVAVVIAVASGGTSSSSTSARQSSAAVRSLLAGIPQSGNTLGRSSAPVTVTVYEDLECPVCKAFTLTAENKLIANEVRAGRAKLVFRSLQTATPDPATFQFQQQAAVAAGKQNKLWPFVELFYHQQGTEGTPYVTESYIDGLARQIPGFDVSAWKAARNSPAIARAVTADGKLAQASKFSATPTITVQGPNGTPNGATGDLDYATLQSMVKKAGG